MKKLILLLIFTLFATSAYAEKIPFDYEINYTWWAWGDFGTYHGYNNVFYNVPVAYANHPLNFTLNLSSKKDLKDIKIILIQEYYCETEQIGDLEFKCIRPDFGKMTGNAISIYNFSEINKDQSIFLNVSYISGQETFNSLDRTHLIVMHCPNNYCEEHWNEFWDTYYHRYYNYEHLNKTILNNDEWKFFKWGKIIVDDPFAGIWCAIK